MSQVPIWRNPATYETFHYQSYLNVWTATKIVEVWLQCGTNPPATVFFICVGGKGQILFSVSYLFNLCLRIHSFFASYIFQIKMINVRRLGKIKGGQVRISLLILRCNGWTVGWDVNFDYLKLFYGPIQLLHN